MTDLKQAGKAGGANKSGLATLRYATQTGYFPIGVNLQLPSRVPQQLKVIPMSSHLTRWGAMRFRNSLELMIFVLFQNFGK